MFCEKQRICLGMTGCKYTEGFSNNMQINIRGSLGGSLATTAWSGTTNQVQFTGAQAPKSTDDIRKCSSKLTNNGSTPNSIIPSTINHMCGMSLFNEEVASIVWSVENKEVAAKAVVKAATGTPWEGDGEMNLLGSEGENTVFDVSPPSILVIEFSVGGRVIHYGVAVDGIAITVDGQERATFWYTGRSVG
ncbi:hypothetical protein C5167_017258 [Papaver somniferum]|uniref:Uncharacterized protein n=1 Tax=Papaver somniferum TaxID=3469 RepID=A0A4Y7IM07_PAPSO|nr:hypothetical protein C5167_017258 [Papaver somniferum]